MAVLTSAVGADVNMLKTRLSLTGGNLFVRLRKLEEAG